MSEYEKVVKGKLKLKGKALDVKTGGGGGVGVSKKRKKKHKTVHLSPTSTGGNTITVDHVDANETENDGGKKLEDYLTPAQRRYMQHWEKIDRQRLAKMATKSHHDRIQEFNQYLANLTEHYDIPKVGPG